MNLRRFAFALSLAIPLLTGAATLSPAATWIGAQQSLEGSPWTCQVLSSDASGTRVLLECPGIYLQTVIQNGAPVMQVVLPDAGVTTDIGWPELPALCRLLVIPDDREPQVIIRDVSYQRIPCDNPCLAEPVEGSFSMLDSQVAPTGIFPQDWAEVQAPAILKDYRIAPLNLYPVRYDPVERELLLAHRLEVEVQTLQPSTVNVKTHHAPVSNAFEPLYQAMIDNRSSFNTATPLVGEGSRGDYIIIIEDSFTSNTYLLSFMEWKRQLGYQVSLFPLSEAGSTKEEIKETIMAEYYDGDGSLDYVLLVGDVTGTLSIPAYTIIKPGGGEQDVTDHPYAMLEGQDYFPDVMIGRLPVSTASELATALNKAMKYQRDPYTYDPNWFDRALVVAGNYSDTGIAPITPVWTSMWLVEKMVDYGYSQVDSIFYWGSTNPYLPPLYNWPGTTQIAASINDGKSMIAYRGWADESGWQYPVFSVDDVYELTNGQKMPVVVSIVCETGNFGDTVDPCFGEAWVRAGSPTTPIGGVAFFGPSDLHTNTKWNNALYAGFFEGMLEENLYRLGQAGTRSKFELYYGFPENTGPGDFAEFYFHVYNVLGDPELPIWSAVPSEISLDIPAQVQPGQQLVTATVTDASGAPLGGAYLAFYKENEVLAGGVAFGDGTVSVEIEPLTSGDIIVTASKQNCKPQQDTVVVTMGDFPLGISDLTIDGDGVASAGETVELTVTVHNYGTGTLSGVEADLSESDPHVSVLTPPPVLLGAITPSGEAGAAFSVDIASSCPEGHMVEFTLALSDDAFHNAEVKFLLAIGGLQFVPAGFVVETGSLEPGNSANFLTLINNAGTQVAQGVTGTLTCSDGAVTVTADQAVFPEIQPGATAASSTAYSVDVDAGAVVGRQVIFKLDLTTASGHSQTISFPVQLGQPMPADPLGPDSYGYFAYDDTDIGYTEAPVFDWVELDTAYGGTFDDHFSMADDTSLVVELPFVFTFYGNDYDSLTICSNGWVSMGETWMANFRNWNLPSALGPPALISPFWDDLKADTTGGNPGIDVFSDYDAAGNRFIVEWSRCINRYRYEEPVYWEEETFQVILYDPAFNATLTGDGEIVFQYLVVNDVDDNNNYATVGIEDEEHLRGLQYAYSNQYPPSAAVLADSLAIKITTDPPDPFGESLAGSQIQTEELRLFAPVPNPANPAASLRFVVPSDGFALLALYNTLGQRVATLLEDRVNAGRHRVDLDATHLASGMYFAILRFEGAVLNQKVLILK